MTYFYSCQSQGYHVLFIGLDFSGVCIEIGNKLVIVCHLRLPFSFTYIDLINLNVSPSSYLVKAWFIYWCIVFFSIKIEQKWKQFVLVFIHHEHQVDISWRNILFTIFVLTIYGGEKKHAHNNMKLALVMFYIYFIMWLSTVYGNVIH